MRARDPDSGGFRKIYGPCGRAMRRHFATFAPGAPARAGADDATVLGGEKKNLHERLSGVPMVFCTPEGTLSQSLRPVLSVVHPPSISSVVRRPKTAAVNHLTFRLRLVVTGVAPHPSRVHRPENDTTARMLRRPRQSSSRDCLCPRRRITHCGACPQQMGTRVQSPQRMAQPQSPGQMYPQTMMALNPGYAPTQGPNGMMMSPQQMTSPQQMQQMPQMTSPQQMPQMPQMPQMQSSGGAVPPGMQSSPTQRQPLSVQNQQGMPNPDSAEPKLEEILQLHVLS